MRNKSSKHVGLRVAYQLVSAASDLTLEIPSPESLKLASVDIFHGRLPASCKQVETSRTQVLYKISRIRLLFNCVCLFNNSYRTHFALFFKLFCPARTGLLGWFCADRAPKPNEHAPPTFVTPSGLINTKFNINN